MTGGRVFFMVFYALLALLGLFTAAAAHDVGMTIFGWGLLIFGVLNVFNGIRVHYDEMERH